MREGDCRSSGVRQIVDNFSSDPAPAATGGRWCATTAGGSILLNWFHPAIPLDPPPGWLVSLVYGLPPLAAVFAWHLFLQRLAHRRQQHPQQTEQDPARPGRLPAVRPLDLRQDPASADPRGTVRALLAHETPQSRVSAATVQQATGLSRLNAKLIEEAAEVIGVTASELADVLEVVYALAAANGIARRDLEQVRQDKRDARGGFTRGTLWLDSDGPGGTP